MTIEYRKDEQSNKEWPVLTACPYCEEPIAGGSSLRHHLPCEGVPETEVPR